MYKARGQLNRQELSDLDSVEILETKHPETIEDHLTNQDKPRKKRKRPHVLLIICGLLIVIGSGLAILYDRWDNGSIAVDDLTSLSVTLNINSHPQLIQTNCSTVGDLLSELGIRLTEYDYIALDMEQPLYNGMNIWLRLAVDITIVVDGKNYSLRSQPITVEEAIEQAGIELNEADFVSLPLLQYIYEDTSIRISRVRTEEETVEESIPYETISREYTYLAPGSSDIVVKGIDGIREATYAVSYCDDEEIGRVLLSSTVSKEPTTQIIGYGPSLHTSESEDTDSSIALGKIDSVDDTLSFESVNTDGDNEIDYTQTGGTADTDVGDSGANEADNTAEPKNMATTESGANFYYSASFTVEATAYTWTGNQTATGTWPAVGTIAVDPDVIPLGSKVYVVGYGFATAEDTGGAINGHIIDLYMDTEEECMQWGRQNVTIYILEE